MDFKENVINFFSLLALLRGPIAWPDLPRGPLIEHPWARFVNYNLI